jgi:hypothetical protein
MAAERTPSREITPEHLYWDRRSFLKAGAAAASVLVTGWAYRRLNRTGSMPVTTEEIAGYTPGSPENLAQGFTLNEPQTSIGRSERLCFQAVAGLRRWHGPQASRIRYR